MRKFKASDVTKGRKTHVGKQYVQIKNGGELIDFEIIHKDNTESKVYVYGEETQKEINLEADVKSLTLKKAPIPSYGIGEVKGILVTRNNKDFLKE